MEDNVPTFAYEYDTAVKEGYLVPYYNYEVKSKFVSEGIDYDQLSDDDKSVMKMILPKMVLMICLNILPKD